MTINDKGFEFEMLLLDYITCLKSWFSVEFLFGQLQRTLSINERMPRMG